MEGYEVITSDDRKAGRVVEVKGDNLIVEHGLLLKRRHAVPQAFAHADEAQHVVRLSVSSWSRPRPRSTTARSTSARSPGTTGSRREIRHPRRKGTAICSRTI